MILVFCELFQHKMGEEKPAGTSVKITDI